MKKQEFESIEFESFDKLKGFPWDEQITKQVLSPSPIAVQFDLFHVEPLQRPVKQYEEVSKWQKRKQLPKTLEDRNEMYNIQIKKG